MKGVQPMWKEFRKSWEAWREKVDEAIGGTVEPIVGANVSFDPTDTDLSATNVQGAIEEVNEKIHDYAAPDAEHVDYDNTDSGLAATNVQDAIDEVNTALADKVDKVTGKGLSENDYTDADKTIVGGVTAALAGKVDKTSVGAANGVAELGADGKVLSSQLPAAVDSIVEGYYYNDKFYEEATHETEITPASNVIYIDLVSEKTYRWGGTVYVEISQSLALGETSSTAYRGDRGKTAYDFSQTPYASSPSEDGTASAGSSNAWARGDHVHPHDSTKVDKVNGKGLSANDFTDTLKTKLDGIAAGAEVNVQADYAQSDNTADDYIKNKPVVDATPTSDSDNLVKSGGVFTAVSGRMKKYTWGTNAHHLEITIPTSGRVVQLITAVADFKFDYDGTNVRILEAVKVRNIGVTYTYSVSGSTIVIDAGTALIKGYLLTELDDVTVTASETSVAQANTISVFDIKGEIDGKPTRYNIPTNTKHITISASTTGTVIKFITNLGELWCDYSGGNIRFLGRVLANRNFSSTPSITYAISGNTIEIDSDITIVGFILASANDLEITTSTTSTPLANAAEIVNFKLSATTSNDGLMSALDKTTLDNLVKGIFNVPYQDITANVAKEIASSRGVYIVMFTPSSGGDRVSIHFVTVSDTASESYAVNILAPTTGTVTFDLSVAGKCSVTRSTGGRCRVIRIATAHY